MLYLKEANFQDIEKEYEYITNLPKNENGFFNTDYNCSKEDFEKIILPRYIDNAKGVNLVEGRVPSTEYFLWNDDEIVGLFRLRHYLNDFLREYAGHIGYGIKKEFRGQGYAKEGLKLLINIAKEIVPEDEIYMSVHKNNLASLKTQLSNGAYIHHEDDERYYTRIDLKYMKKKGK